MAFTKPRLCRLLVVVAVLVVAGSAVGLILNAFNSNLVFFFSPSQVMAGEAPADRDFRLGGLVESGSLQRTDGGLQAEFVLTDKAKSIPVVYRGILPDLFGEGQGAVTMGRMGADGRFVAEQVLAKHDENYMPPEVAASLKEARADTATETVQ